MATNLGSIYAELRLRLDKLKDDVQNAKAQMTQVGEDSGSALNRLAETGKKMQDVGKTLTKYVTAPIIGLATAAVMTASSFDDAMAKVKAISGATGEDFDRLADQARELGATTRYTAREAAASMESLARAGFSVDEILDTMPGLLDLAAAGALDLDLAATITADSLRAFGEEADQAGRFADVLALAAARSNTDVRGLGEAFSYGAPAAAAAGMTLEQTAAIMSALADAGIKSTRAGTTFEATLRDIRDKSKEGSIAVDMMAYGLENFAIRTYDAEGNMRDMLSIMADVEEATKGMTVEERNHAMAQIFSTVSMRAANIIMSRGTENIRALENELMNASGSAEEMADVMLDTLGGSIIILKSAIEGLMIEFGEVMVPTIRTVAEALTRLTEWFINLSPAAKKIITIVALLVAALGPLLVFIGTLLTMLPLMKAGFLMVKVAAGVVLVPLLKIIAIVAAIVAAIHVLYRAWTENWGGIQDIVGNAVDWIMDKFGWLIDGLKSIGGWVKDAWARVTEFFGWTKKTVVDEVAEMSNETTAEVVKMSQDVEGQLFRLSLNSNRISKDMADRNIAEAKRERDARIAEVEEMAEETIANAEFARDVTGEMSAEQADKVIAEAKRMRDEAVEEAKAKANATISEYERMADGARHITTEMADDIIETSNRMKEMAVQAIKEQHEESIEAMTFLRDEAGTITEEQFQRMMEIEEERKQAQIENQEELNKAVVERIRELEEQGVEITDEMRQEIEELFFAQRDSVIEATAGMGAEVEMILSKLRNDSNEITLEMASEAIRNSAEQRDATIEAAEEMYEDTIRNINALSDEAIEATGMTRDELIQAAREQRDGTVQAAEEMHEDMVNEVGSMMDESIERIDTGTGEILTGWQVFRKDWWGNTKQWVSDTVASAMELRERAQQAILEWLSNLPETIGYWLGRAVRRFIEFQIEVPGIMKNAARDAVNGFISFFLDLPKLVADAIGNVVKTIKDAASELWSAAKEAAGNAWKGFKDGLGISSPSYLEEAMIDIMRQSKKMVDQIGSDFKDLDRYSARPGLELLSATSDRGEARQRSGTGAGYQLVQLMIELRMEDLKEIKTLAEFMEMLRLESRLAGEFS